MAQGITGPDGKVIFPALDPATYTVHTQHGDFAPEPDVDVVVAGVPVQVNITLDPKSADLTVLVVDRAGAPVPGATVTVVLKT